MDNGLKIKMNSFTMDCKDPHELAKFYTKLINWEIAYEDEEYSIINAPGTQHGSYPNIVFQKNLDYIAHVWPEKSEAQQQMAHLDFAVNDLEEAVQYALDCGARIADEQFSDHWRVMLDPAGHPFCLCLAKSIFESEHFGLL